MEETLQLSNVIPLHETLKSLPREWPTSPQRWIRERITATGEKLAVVDDDPAGTQTIYGVSVLTNWSVESIMSELESDLPAFFITTNSRSMPLSKAKAVSEDVGRNLKNAIETTGIKTAIFSRGDSTLRGHYLSEIDALQRGLGGRIDARIVIPFFLEGGRYTIADIHYVSDGVNLIPVADTEFARDPIFHYRSSNIRHWIEEISDGHVRSNQITAISIEDIRCGGPDHVASIATGFLDERICVVNAASMRDVEVVIQGLMIAESRGKKFLYRTAASALKARIGQSTRRLLNPDELDLPVEGGALIVVGSYVNKTTKQLSRLLQAPDVHGVEMDVSAVLGGSQQMEIKRIVAEVNWRLSLNQNVAIYTSRKVLNDPDVENNTRISQLVSDALVTVVSRITVRPRFILTKGGTTTSNIASRSLYVKRAISIGQLFPGIPTWRLGCEARFPGLIMVVFPGNVGDTDGLLDMMVKLGSAG